MSDEELDIGGRIVRGAWIKWAMRQPNCKSRWTVPYDQLPDADKEADREIYQTVITKLNVRKEEPDKIDGDLLDKALSADFSARNAGDYEESTDDEKIIFRKGMAASVRVIADVLLGPVTFNEAVKFGPGAQTEEERSFKVDAMMAARRARIEAKPKDTVVDRLAASLKNWEDSPYPKRSCREIAVEIVAALKKDGEK